MKVYNYDSKGYLVGIAELDDSDKDPLGDGYLIPAGATEIEPTLKDGYLSKFSGNEWVYEKILTTEEKKIEGIVPLGEGERIVNNALQLVPSPGKFYSWNFDSCEWKFDESKKQAKINEINSKAYHEITLLYPDWKQANITADYLQYPDNDIFKKNFEEMRLCINQIRTNADLEVMKLD